MTYGSETVEFSASEMRNSNTAINDESKALHEQEITSLQELSFGVLPYTSRNVLVKRFFNFQMEE